VYVLAKAHQNNEQPPVNML